MADQSKTITFELEGILFEYDEEKNRINQAKHGISFEHAARVFFDYNRIEMYDEENSVEEDRYDTIGDVSFGFTNAIGNIAPANVSGGEILFVVYTERIRRAENARQIDVTRIISARYATNFERGLYYGKHD